MLKVPKYHGKDCSFKEHALGSQKLWATKLTTILCPLLRLILFRIRLPGGNLLPNLREQHPKVVGFDVISHGCRKTPKP